MAKKRQPPPPSLEATVRGLKRRLARDLSRHSAAEVAALHVDCMSMLYYLAVDFSCINSNSNGSTEPQQRQCPEAENIPAVTAVLHDESLFRALLKCLHQVHHESSDRHHYHNHGVTSSVVGGNSASVVGKAASGSSVAGRKRSMSFSSESVAPPVKSFKAAINLSPNPVGDHSRQKSVVLSSASSSATPLAQQQQQQSSAGGGSGEARYRPAFNVPVVAASILYAAFRHVDHWPAPLVRAYADDCFGPRLWVDDPRCRDLVENLALVHDPARQDESPLSSEELLEDAKLVEEAYRNFVLVAVATEEVAGATNKRRRLSNGVNSTERSTASSNSSKDDNDSAASSSSASGDEEEEVITEEVVGPNAGRVNEVQKTTTKCGGKRKGGENDDGDSSSSGEEDEEVEVAVTVNGVNPSAAAATKTTKSRHRSKLYPVQQRWLSLARIRKRYHGANLEAAYRGISSSLSDRLDVRSKQNSGLLQSLPSFTTVPGVRGMIAENLEKWLQSPALAGLARTLLSSTVQNLQNVDPPLEDDIKAVDSILGMRLKANQLNAHLENITAIARGIPSASVANIMYSKLIPGILESLGTTGSSNSDELKMAVAVHRAMPAQISYDAIAATLLTILVRRAVPEDADSAQQRHQRVRRLQLIIRALALELGADFEGSSLMRSFLSLDVSGGSWSIDDEEDKARLMFQCVTMHVAVLAGLATGSFSLSSKQSNGNGLSPSSKSKMRNTLLSARKSLLSWYCVDYAPRCSTKLLKWRKDAGKGSDLVGAGAPDFHSVLGPSRGEERIQPWLNIMRCLLFLEDADSPLMKEFVVPGGTGQDEEGDYSEELSRIRICCELGAGIDDEMIWIIIRTSASSDGKLPAHVAIELLENLFECCAGDRIGLLSVSDPTIVWELFGLVEYVPPNRLPGSNDQDQEGGTEKSKEALPRLAYPGLWWRVTMLTLVLSGSSSGSIGAAVWKENPTVQSLIKMIVSDRYRYPTIDCDEDAREQMKKSEQMARDKETMIAERLFLPERKQKKENYTGASRVSKRILRQKQEKEAAKELAETNLRKKLLRKAQKSIMLWDPDGPARKPPREAADLLLSVGSLFDLSDTFQRCIEPDFLLLTLGGTSRGAIERAYDWLIPVISKLPDTIGRLPSSASCFLLLRAYSTDGEEREQLKQLSAPLLGHVADCLQGKHGESDSVRAFDLLMADVASHKAERRRCARRVLYEALQNADSSVTVSSWWTSILKVNFAEVLVADAIKYLYTAASFDRGRVLRCEVMALEEHLKFAESNSIETGLKFADAVVELVSSRPSVFAEAMDSFVDLRSLVIRIVRTQFVAFAEVDPKGHQVAPVDAVIIKPRKACSLARAEIYLPLSVVLSISVVLSTWIDSTDDKESLASIGILSDALLRSGGNEDEADDDNAGLAGAITAESKTAAISVESWITLAKARSDTIARRAALSAPTSFLPRLLLCSGLPRTSLVTMIDRLGRLGDSASDRDNAFRELFSSSLSSGWGSGRIGHRRDTARHLLGRLAAYTRLNALPVNLRDSNDSISTSFLQWLSQECMKADRVDPRNQHQRKKKRKRQDCAELLNSVSACTLVKDVIAGDVDKVLNASELSGSVSEIHSFLPVDTAQNRASSTMDIAESPIDPTGLSGKSIGSVEEVLREFSSRTSESGSQSSSVKSNATSLCVQLLTFFKNLEEKNERANLLVLKWVPLLSRRSGSIDLWRLLFTDSANPVECRTLDDLATKCMSCWDTRHVQSCVSWMTDVTGDVGSKYSAERMVRFLVSVSSASPCHLRTFSEGPTAYNNAIWYNSVETSSALTSIATSRIGDKSFGDDSKRRNVLSASVTLLLQIAGTDRQRARKATDSILTAVAKFQKTKCAVLEAVLLRIYLLRPNWMELGKASVRSALVDAVNTHSTVWMDWRSSLDDQLENMLEALVGGDLRLTRPFQDLSRNHPLLVLRKIPDMVSRLEEDATFGTHHEIDTRVVRGEAVNGSRDAIVVGGGTVRVTVRYWGFCYTETLWVALLDVLAGIHKEVLFNSGLKLGTLSMLETYVKLMSVQSELLSADKATRLKGKLSECFAVFQRTAQPAWRAWLNADIDGSEVRHMLMACGFITPQEAMESLKPIQQT